MKPIIRNIIAAGSGSTIPFKSDAFALYDGTILDVAGTKYFVDKVAGRNLLITNYDFGDYWNDWTKGFPYKSASTVSAPSGDAAFIAADLNNFWYTGGVPNQIPVVSFFQNIDYANRMFCRHQAQSVDINGVETFEARVKEIVLYNNAKTGADLTKCNTYFGVPTKQTTNIREVGIGKSYATIEAAIAAATSGDRIYDYTGIYSHPTTYFNFNKNLLFNALSLVECKQASTTTVFYQTKVNASYVGLIINCESKTTNAITTEAHTIDNVYDVIVTNCLFKNINTRINGGSKGYKWLVSNSIAEKATSFTWGTRGTTVFNGNKIKNALLDFILGGTFNNNKYESSITTAHTAITLQNGNCYLTNNSFIITNNGIRSIGTYDRLITEINYNTFYIKDIGSSLSVIACAILDTFLVNSKITFKFNKIYQLGDFTSTGGNGGLSVYNNSADIESNIMVITATSLFAAINVYFNASNNLSTYNIKNNYIKSNWVNSGSGGLLLTIGQEQSYDNCHENSIIETNYLENTGTNTGLHGMLINCGINNHIRFNKIKGCYYGIVVKTGTTAKAYTQGGVYSNVTTDCAQGARIKGVGGINVFGNTFINCSNAGVMCDENGVQSGEQYTENCIIKNNIITTTINGYCIYFDAHAAANGCTADYNVYYSTKSKPFYIGGTEYTFQEWQALGYDTHSIMLTTEQFNLLFPNGQLWPTTPIAQGETLDSAYDDGLDISTNWGNETTLPVVVTKQQTEAQWQVGAYVQN